MDTCDIAKQAFYLLWQLIVDTSCKIIIMTIQLQFNQALFNVSIELGILETNTKYGMKLKINTTTALLANLCVFFR